MFISRRRASGDEATAGCATKRKVDNCFITPGSDSMTRSPSHLTPTKQVDYGETSTLPLRVNKHCLLLAQRKQASPIGNPPAAVPVAFSNLLISPPAMTPSGRGCQSVRVRCDGPRPYEPTRVQASGICSGMGTASAVSQHHKGSSHGEIV